MAPKKTKKPAKIVKKKPIKKAKVWKTNTTKKGYKAPKVFPKSKQPKKYARGKIFESEEVVVRLNVPPKQIEKEVQEKEAITPMDIEEVKKVIHDIVGQELEDIQKEYGNRKSCIVCGSQAQYYIKSRPNDTYCKDCGTEYFKFLSYLEKL